MHRLLDTTLRSIRQDLDTHLDRPTVEQVCRQVGHRWRSCGLTPHMIVHWLLTQVLHRNTSLQHLSLLGARHFSASALCQARARLPLGVLSGLLARLVTSARDATDDDGSRFNGRRVLLVDGSSFSMPDTPELQRHFGQHPGQHPGCGFPTAKILALFHARTGLLMSVSALSWRAHELANVERFHPALRRGDVLVGDRGLCSYAHLALLRARGVEAVLRVHQKQIVDFTPHRPHAQGKGATGRPRSRWLRAAGLHDQTVEWLKPASRPSWMTPEQFAALPESIVVREVRYTVSRPGSRTREVTLVTTLLDADRDTPSSLAALYGIRWRVEQDLRDLKQTMGLDVLKCRTVAGVTKELMAYAIVYNLVRVVMDEAGRRQRVVADRISFADAMRWLVTARDGDALPRLVVNPTRPNRCEPRVCKRRPKSYPLMMRSRSELREALITQRVIA